MLGFADAVQLFWTTITFWVSLVKANTFVCLFSLQIVFVIILQNVSEMHMLAFAYSCYSMWFSLPLHHKDPCWHSLLSFFISRKHQSWIPHTHTAGVHISHITYSELKTLSTQNEYNAIFKLLNLWLIVYSTQITMTRILNYNFTSYNLSIWYFQKIRFE